MVIERVDDPDPPHRGTATMRVVPAADPAPAQPPPAAPSSASWTVAPGESLWGKAEAVLSAAWGRSPSDREVAPYWRSLVDANRSRLADPQNPDLIFSGQRLEVPPPPTG
jgi:nucleoid-associated protein YgaU